MVLVLQHAYADQLFSIDVEGIRQAAAEAAYTYNPEYRPGDLTESGNGAVLIVCSPASRSNE